MSGMRLLGHVSLGAALLTMGLCATVVAQTREQSSPRIALDGTTGSVLVRVPAGDVNRLSLGLRRNHFAVFEDGVPQRDVNVEIEHAPITLAVLVESGGRSHQVNELVAGHAEFVVRPVADRLGPDDKLALFTYDDQLHEVLGFDDAPDKRQSAFREFTVPRFSEANFYDAAAHVLDRLAAMPGRKALLMITTGVDTFSKTTFDDLLSKARTGNVPIYVVGEGALVRRRLSPTHGPFARVDWAAVDRQLGKLASVSGGRAYLSLGAAEIASAYDEIMERLRVTYVLSYSPGQPPAPGTSRRVSVRLIDPSTGEPTHVANGSPAGRSVAVIADASYTQGAAGAPPSGGDQVSEIRKQNPAALAPNF
jgi:Ca-activated chloride channel homolog